MGTIDLNMQGGYMVCRVRVRITVRLSGNYCSIPNVIGLGLQSGLGLWLVRDSVSVSVSVKVRHGFRVQLDLL